MKALLILFLASPVLASGQFDGRDHGLKASFKLHMNEGTGNTLVNLQGPTFPLSNTLWAKGRYVTGLQFSIAGARAGTIDTGFPAGSTARTFITWIQTLPGKTGVSGIFAYGTDAGSQRFLIRGEGEGGSGAITVAYSSNDQTYTAVTLEPWPAWNLLYYAYTGGDPGTEIVVVYVNGKIKRGRRQVSGLNTVLTGTSVWLGNFLAGASECKCVLDDAQLYNGYDGGRMLNQYLQSAKGSR